MRPRRRSSVPAVGLHAGERPDQRRTCRGRRGRRWRSRPSAGPPPARAATSASSADGGRLRRSSSVRSPSTWPTTGGDPRRSGSAKRRRERDRGAGQRELGRASPTDTRLGVHGDGVQARGGEPAGERVGPCRAGRRRRRRASAAPAARGPRSVASSAAERGLVHPQRPVQRVPAQPLHQRRPCPAPARPAGRRAACRRWPARGPRRRPGSSAGPARRAAAGAGRSSPRADVGDQRDAGAGQRGRQLGHLDRPGEAADDEVATGAPSAPRRSSAPSASR